MTRYPVLQSGFVSLVPSDLVVPLNKVPGLTNAVLSKDYLNKENNKFFSPSIKKLYGNFNRNQNVLIDFEFREEITKTALYLFGTPSFFQWLKFQREQRTLGHMHYEFLEQTLAFISGHPRSLHVTQWLSLLEPVDKSVSGQFNFERFFIEAKKNPKDIIIPSATTDLITQWLCREGGYTDLLTSLLVIFGPREGVTDVSSGIKP